VSDKTFGSSQELIAYLKSIASEITQVDIHVTNNARTIDPSGTIEHSRGTCSEVLLKSGHRLQLARLDLQIALNDGFLFTSLIPIELHVTPN